MARTDNSPHYFFENIVNGIVVILVVVVVTQISSFDQVWLRGLRPPPEILPEGLSPCENFAELNP